MKKATVWTNGDGPARRAAWLTLATAVALVATALTSGPAWAVDGRELARDHRNRHHDVVDVRRFERLVDDLEDAQRARAWREEQFVRRQIHQAVRRELEEGRRDVFADGRERGTEPSRQGRWDDEKDFRQSRHRFERQREIARELRWVQDDILRGGWRARSRERALLGEFLRLMRQDARQSAWELREDRRDFRDRRGYDD
ncbi:MAG TPA: hypothetical protein VFP58_08700 [Candidatus Eisenbacteria bacterium]|nr:hypothetical protein [Candidatus Eisenbacteria bacterium]